MALASVTIESTLSPPVTLTTDDVGGGSSGSPSGAAGGGGFSPGKWLRGLLRLKVSVTTPVYSTVKAPDGEPGDAWMVVLPLVAVALVALVALAVVGVVSLARRR